MTEVFDRVLLGNKSDAQDGDLFLKEKIGLVINATDNIGNHFASGKMRRRVKVQDQTEEMKILSQSSDGLSEIVFENGKNITPVKSSSISSSIFDREDSSGLMFDDEDEQLTLTQSSNISEGLQSYTSVDSMNISSVEDAVVSSSTDTSSDLPSATKVDSLTSFDPMLLDDSSVASALSSATNDDSSMPAPNTPTSASKKKKRNSSQKKLPRKKSAIVIEEITLEHPVLYHNIAIVDSMDQNIQQHFDEAVDKVDDFLATHPNSKVLIHCREGKSRSVSTLIAYGMKHQRLSLAKCYEHVTECLQGRDRINDGFKRQLMEYELILKKRFAIKDIQEKREKEHIQTNPEIPYVPLAVTDMDLPEETFENSMNFFKRTKFSRSYNEVNEAAYHDEDEDEEFVDFEDEEEDDYEPEKKKRRQKKSTKKVHQPKFVKSWSEINIGEKTVKTGKQLDLLSMFAKKTKPVPIEKKQEHPQPTKQASLDSIFSPKKPKSKKTEKKTETKPTVEASQPKVESVVTTDEAQALSVQPTIPTKVMDVTTDVIVTPAEQEVQPALDETTFTTTDKKQKKKKDKDQNKPTKKIFKRALKNPLPQPEPIPEEEPKKKEKKKDKKEKKKSEKKDKKKKGEENSTEPNTTETVPAQPTKEPEPVTPAQPTNPIKKTDLRNWFKPVKV